MIDKHYKESGYIFNLDLPAILYQPFVSYLTNSGLVNREKRRKKTNHLRPTYLTLYILTCLVLIFDKGSCLSCDNQFLHHQFYFSLGWSNVNMSFDT